MGRHGKYKAKDAIRIYRRNMQGEDISSLLREFDIPYLAFKKIISRIFHDAGRESPYDNMKRIKDSDIDDIKDESLSRQCSVQLICEERGLPYEMIINRMACMGYKIGQTDISRYYMGKYRSCRYCKKDSFCERIEQAVECDGYDFDLVKRLKDLKKNAQRNYRKQIAKE